MDEKLKQVIDLIVDSNESYERRCDAGVLQIESIISSFFFFFYFSLSLSLIDLFIFIIP